MLTIKIIDNGLEIVKEVKTVMFRPRREKTENDNGCSFLTYFEKEKK